MRGTIKFFEANKGYGFIRRNVGTNKDVFVHINAIEDGETPHVGDEIEFEIETTDRGERAARGAKLIGWGKVGERNGDGRSTEG